MGKIVVVKLVVGKDKVSVTCAGGAVTNDGLVNPVDPSSMLNPVMVA